METQKLLDRAINFESLIAANISLRQWRRKREIAKTEKQYTLEQRLEREKNKFLAIRLLGL